ncbi:hypothetical protein ABT084_11780 [Streptomyces sp. NPDC002138]
MIVKITTTGLCGSDLHGRTVPGDRDRDRDTVRDADAAPGRYGVLERP